jgi:hypothetical protein
LIKVAAGAADDFKGSRINEKREILSFVFQNLILKEKKLDYTMRWPFNLFVDANKPREWCPEEDSNFHDPKTAST